MAINVQQTVSDGGSGGATTVSVEISNTQPGAVLHVAVFYFRYSFSAIVGIEDTQENTFDPIDDEIVGTDAINARHFYAENIAGGVDPNTITVTFDESTTYREIIVKEVRDVATAGALVGDTQQEQASPGTGTDAVTSGAAAISAQPNLLSGFSMVQFFSDDLTEGTGFSRDARSNNGSNGGGGWIGQSKRTTSTSSQASTCTTTLSGQNFSNMLAVFKESVPAAPGPGMSVPHIAATRQNPLLRM